MTSVAIIDDHAMVRRGVEFMLQTCPDEFCFAGESAGGEGAGSFVRSVQPDVLLLDIRMPGTNGIAALREIIIARPAQRVIMLTTSEADNDVYEAVRIGAKGYLMKDRDSGELLAAIRAVAAGKMYMPESVRSLYEQRSGMLDMTVREMEVLDLIARGFTNSDIARILEISRDTVKGYVKGVYEKLDVSDRVTATTEAYRRGFLRRD